MKHTEYMLRAILENPDDNLARLAYADALDEEGDTTGQAELIRAGDDPVAIRGALRNTRYANIVADALEGRPVIGNNNPYLHLFYGKEDNKLCATLFLFYGFARRVDTDIRWWQRYGKKLCEIHPVREAYGLEPRGRLGGWGWDQCSPKQRVHGAWAWDADDIRRYGKLEESLREFLCVRLTQRFYINTDEARADFNVACLEWARPEWLRSPQPKPSLSQNTVLQGRGGYVTAGGVPYKIKSWTLGTS